MPTNVDEKIKQLNPAQRKKVEARAAELIAEEMTLRELRHARKLTQVRIAKKLGITQDSVSRLEKRSDLLLSTLRKTIRGRASPQSEGRRSLKTNGADNARQRFRAGHGAAATALVSDFGAINCQRTSTCPRCAGCRLGNSTLATARHKASY